MSRHFGLIRTFRYERARRGGFLLDYAEALTPEEMAFMEEHFEHVPWKNFKVADADKRRTT